VKVDVVAGTETSWIGDADQYLSEPIYAKKSNAGNLLKDCDDLTLHHATSQNSTLIYVWHTIRCCNIKGCGVMWHQTLLLTPIAPCLAHITSCPPLSSFTFIHSPSLPIRIHIH
jgi:hypothetical protein